MRREETEDGVEGERDEKINEGKEIEWQQRTRGKGAEDTNTHGFHPHGASF